MDSAAKVEYFDRNFTTKTCCHCAAAIVIKKAKVNALALYNYRRCSGYPKCEFIVCSPNCDESYKWTGNPWLGVHPRPVEDYDYVCCPECPAKN